MRYKVTEQRDREQSFIIATLNPPSEDLLPASAPAAEISSSDFSRAHLHVAPHLESRWGWIHDMGDGSDYPSPRSEGAGGTAAMILPAQESLPHPPAMGDQLAPDFVEGARPRLSVRRAREPPKNPAGQIYCDHPDCEPSPPTFRRPCEWK